MIKVFKNGAWQDDVTPKRWGGGQWQDAENVKRFDGTNWIDCINAPKTLYLIKDRLIVAHKSPLKVIENRPPGWIDNKEKMRDEQQQFGGISESTLVSYGAEIVYHISFEKYSLFKLLSQYSKVTFAISLSSYTSEVSRISKNTAIYIMYNKMFDNARYARKVNGFTYSNGTYGGDPRLPFTASAAITSLDSNSDYSDTYNDSIEIEIPTFYTNGFSKKIYIDNFYFEK